MLKIKENEPSEYKKDSRGRVYLQSTCAVCGRKKAKYVKNNEQVGKVRKTKRKSKN